MLEIIFTIFLPVLFWIFTPKQFKEFISDKIFRDKIRNVDNMMNELNKIGLNIEMGDLLSTNYFVEKKRYVYFPVVPRDKFNLIHYTFSYVIKELEKRGLKIIIFIFDDYYAKIQNLDNNIKKIHIKNFTNYFRKLGVKSHIIYESKVNKNYHYLKHMNKIINNLKTTYTISEVQNINKFNKHIFADTQYIRYEKFFLNQAHFINLKYNFGYILSGNDETQMWTKFLEIYAKQGKNNFTEVVLLSIPKLYNIKGELSDVLDVLSITYTNNYDEILSFVRNNLKKHELIKKDCGIFYLFNNVYFKEKKHITLMCSDNISRKFESTDELIDFCKEGEKYDDIIFCESISNLIYKTFHIKKEE